MRRRLNRAQRVVVVIGRGLFLFFASNYVLVAGWQRPDGWFNYAPNNHSAYSRGGGAFSTSTDTASPSTPGRCC
jgi:hypothetical protein